jgi:hypothetical protein
VAARSARGEGLKPVAEVIVKIMTLKREEVKKRASPEEK